MSSQSIFVILLNFNIKYQNTQQIKSILLLKDIEKITNIWYNIVYKQFDNKAGDTKCRKKLPQRTIRLKWL